MEAISRERMLEVEKFLDERREALWTLDKTKLADFIRKYRIMVPDDEQKFWAAVHKQRIHEPSLPKGAKDYSEQWLRNHGYSTALDLRC